MSRREVEGDLRESRRWSNILKEKEDEGGKEKRPDERGQRMKGRVRDSLTG